MPLKQLTLDAFAAREEGQRLLQSVTDATEIWRVERVIAVTRVLVALISVAIVRLNPVQARQFDPLMSGLVVAYGSFALLFLLVLPRHHPVPRRLPLFLHAADVFFVAVLALLANGLNGSLFVLLLYPLLAAGYRWAFSGVMTTALLLDALLLAEWILVRSRWGLSFGISREQFNVHLFDVMFVLVAGVVLGYLAENETRRRSEAAAFSRVVAQGRPGAGLDEMLKVMLARMRDVFRAQAALLVLRDTRTTRIFQWRTNPVSEEESPGAQELPATAASRYLFEAPGVAWHSVARGLWRRGRWDAVVLDKLGHRLRVGEVPIPEDFAKVHPCRRLLGVSLTFSNDLTGRLFLLEPALRVHRDVNARFALRLATEVGRVMYGHYLAHRVRTRAQTEERGRIARELHDGIVQSLLGLEMQIAVLRRRVIDEAPQVDAELARFHALLRNEVIGLRELMEEIRAGDSRSEDVVEELAEMVERFRRYTGIAARFESQEPLKGVSLHTRRQIARILHEALVNVRKHSRAKRVVVRTDTKNGRWRLSVEDDGQGFSFAGRRSQAELDALRQGPRMISERIRLIGGDMIVESRPGTGAFVQITIPLAPRS